MIVTITKVEQAFTRNGAEFKKITCTKDDGGETTKSIFDDLKSKWGLLVEGAHLDLTLKHSGQFWNVSDIKSVDDFEPVPTPTAQLSDEDREQIKKAHEEATRPAPQAVGMWTKEIGDDIRAGLIIKIFGVETAQKLLRWYQEQGIKTTQISVDLSKLPKLEPKSN